MTLPKLHHYVPQFYLRLFADEDGYIWVYDKNTQKVFRTTPATIAAENYFYRVPEFIGTQQDPLFLEKQFSSIEADVSIILVNWLARLQELKPEEKMEIPPAERQLFSFYLSLQILRTADQREILSLLLEEKHRYPSLPDERANLHARILCEPGLVDEIAERIDDSIWVFARNATAKPFHTSDNPVAFKTPNNRMWLKGPNILMPGAYAVFPLSPSAVLYCKDQEQWQQVKAFADCLSPVELTEGMVDHENSGQVFMASRFIISPQDDFEFAKEFVKSIGTDMYADKEPEEG